jgi:hypothetical protein
VEGLFIEDYEILGRSSSRGGHFGALLVALFRALLLLWALLLALFLMIITGLVLDRTEPLLRSMSNLDHLSRFEHMNLLDLRPKLSIIELDAPINNLPGLLLAHKLLNHNLLILQLLIVLEEPMHLIEQMLRYILKLINMPQRLIISGDGDDLIVLLALVEHMHDADDLGLDQAHGLDLDGAQHQDVERVVVLAVGLRDEPVVGGVVHR